MPQCAQCHAAVPMHVPKCPACGTAVDPVTEAMLEDIEEFVQETDPASLPAAEKELAAWAPPDEAPHNTFESEADAELVPVAAAPDEPTAQLWLGILEAEGLEGMLDSRQVAWLGDAMAPGEGEWGDVCVARKDAERAREVLAAYRSAGSDADPGGSSVPAPASPTDRFTQKETL